MRLRALISTAVAAAMLLGVAPSAPADDLGGQRDQAQARQAQVRSQLDLALASDAAVEAHLNILNAEVRSQENLVEDARNAQAAAAVRVTDATVRLAGIGAHLDDTRRQLRDVALRVYMRPSQVSVVVGAADINDVARRQALLSMAAASQSDVIDAFRQAEHDLSGGRTAMQAALIVAAARTRLATDQAVQLSIAERAQEATHAELQKRIADLQKESSDLAAQEAGLEALITARTQAAQAAQTAQAAAAASQSAGAAGLTISGAGLIWPLSGPVTSEFGPRWGGLHPGIDIAPPYGTPIHAAKDGVVIFAGVEGGYGNFVLIDHGGGLVTGYAHQSRLAVTQGQSVTQGQVIGYEGSTGDSTGPHLHFEVRINAAPQNPRAYLAGSP